MSRRYKRTSFDREIDIARKARIAEQDKQWDACCIDNMESTLRNMPGSIRYECGHWIEATVGMLSLVDDGTDLRLCPDCRQ